LLYEEEKMTKEALMKEMDSLKSVYDTRINSLEEENGSTSYRNPLSANSSNNNSRTNMSGSAKPPKSARGNRKTKAQTETAIASNAESTNEIGDVNTNPEERLLKLQELMVGGEQANNEELKKKRIKKKKHAEERKQLLAESLRNGDDDEFMLRVYDSVQEEVQYKTMLLEKEKQKLKFLEGEVKDLQGEFEQEREEYLDTIRKQEKQLKLLSKLTQKIQVIIPHDCNYYNLDKIQMCAVWNEEMQDWILPEMKREKLTLPTMNGDADNYENNFPHETVDSSEIINGNGSYGNHHHQQAPPTHLLLGRRQMTHINEPLLYSREPEVDRYRLKLENSQFDGSNYFKNKRQSELLSQTQDMKNAGRLSPINNFRANRKPFP